MFSKRDPLLHRNHIFLRFKQLILLLFFASGASYSFIKQNLTLDIQYGVIAVVVLITLISLKRRQWLLFLLCVTMVVFNVYENLPPELLYIRSTILTIIGILCLLNMELRYVKDNFGLTMIPPGWGTLKPQHGGSEGRFLSLWELFLNFSWKPGGIWLGRPLPEHRLFGLFNFLKIGHSDNRHFLTIAGSQSGKGTAAVIPNLLLYPGSVIVIDPKGELAAITAARRGYGSKRVKKFLRQDVFVFDPEHIVSGHPSASWNPLAELDSMDLFFEAYVVKIATVIVPIDDKDSSSEFFRNIARNLLIALILYVFFEEQNPDRRNLIYIRQLIMEGDQDAYEGLLLQGFDYGNGQDALFATMEASNIKKIATTAKSLISLAPETRSSAIATLQEQTSFLDHPGMVLYLQHSDFSLSSLKKRPTTIYLCLKGSSLSTSLTRILSIFIDLAIVAIENDQKTKPPDSVLFIIDEFYVLGKNETIDKAMGLVAGLGLALWPILQHLGQLQAHYPNTWDNFIRNCRGLQLFGEQSPDVLKMVEERSGTKAHKRSDGTIERVPLLSSYELSSDYFNRESRRQIYLPNGRPIALLELMDYYRFFPKSWYTDIKNISANDTPNPNPNQIIKLPNAQPVTYLPLSPPLQLAHSGTPKGTRISSIPIQGVGEICCNPNDRSILGLKNLSNQNWKVTLPDGNEGPLVKDQIITLSEGMRINFGQGIGEVCCNPNDRSILGLKNLSNQNWKVTLLGGNEGPLVKGQIITLSEGTRINFDSI